MPARSVTVVSHEEIIHWLTIGHRSSRFTTGNPSYNRGTLLPLFHNLRNMKKNMFNSSFFTSHFLSDSGNDRLAVESNNDEVVFIIFNSILKIKKLLFFPNYNSRGEKSTKSSYLSSPKFWQCLYCLWIHVDLHNGKTYANMIHIIWNYIFIN